MTDMVVRGMQLPGNPLPFSTATEPATKLSQQPADDSSDLDDTEPAVTDPKPSPLRQSPMSPGLQFINWLRDAIQSRRLVINDARALVHTVGGTAYLVSPGIFMRYAQEHPEISHNARELKMPEWEWAQKQFERLRIHKKHANGLNIWTCEVTGPRKSRRLHGYLLLDGNTLFSEVPFDNPHLTLHAEKEIASNDAAA